jgi:transposase InsO family protein
MGDSIAVRYRLRVKQRRRIVEYAREHGIKPAGRHFGLDRRTVRRWVRRWLAGGDEGLVPRYPAKRKRRLPDSTRELIRIARIDHRYGAARAQVWLKRVHQLHVNTGTIQRVFREIGVPVLAKTPKRRPRQMMLFEKEEPGDSVQVDVKVVKLAREKVFQYTALDDCTRYRVLRLYPRQNQYTSLHFLEEVRRHLPFAIRKLQCDNGSEFPLAFKLAVEAAGIRHRYIKPRRPQQNGKVERSHRVDQEEFWSQHTFATRSDAEAPLADWERRYNYERFSLALHGLTPVERLQAKQLAHMHTAVQ